MSDVVVRTTNLTKAYTLYPSHGSRLADLIGWSRLRKKSYPSHLAVDNVSLEIKAGEKVGFIGRNGAGKSTLLKLITGVTEPSSGTLEITGKSHALLQMGAGFHQEFTGRQNAYAYLANLGVVGKAADRLVDEIVEFTELEEYIDQPLKTYSTGMSMRLIFAASTTVAPSLFVVDEVLGVGDAYFQGKSFARLDDLCDKGTTLLLVSHDIYGAARICNRMIWLERGRVKFDGDGKTALNLYESSIKEQEEQRLRRKALFAAAGNSRDRWPSCLLEIRPAGGNALSAPVRFLKADLQRDGQEARDARLEFVKEGSNWSVGESGETLPELSNFGSAFQKGMIKVSAPNRAGLQSLTLNAQLVSAEEQELVALLGDDDGALRKFGDLQLLPGVPADWEIPIAPDDCDDFEGVMAYARHGSGEVRLTGLGLVDAVQRSTALLSQRKPVTFEIDYRLVDSNVAADLELILSISRDGILDVARAFDPELTLNKHTRAGRIHFQVRSLPLSRGTYVVSMLVARRGYYESQSGKPFSINDQVYDVLSRALEFQVTEAHPAFVGTVFELEGAWFVSADGTADGRLKVSAGGK